MQSIGERPTLSFSTAVNADTPRNAIQMMFNGIGWHGEDTLNYMPSFVDQYDDAQIADLAAYVRATYTDRRMVRRRRACREAQKRGHPR